MKTTLKNIFFAGLILFSATAHLTEILKPKNTNLLCIVLSIYFS